MDLAIKVIFSRLGLRSVYFSLILIYVYCMLWNILRKLHWKILSSSHSHI